MIHPPNHEVRDPGKFAVIKDLTQRGNVEETFSRLGELLASSGLHATLKVQLLESAGEAAAPRTTHFTITIAKGKAAVGNDPATKADVELITTPETWWEIASGKTPPHEAFFKGRMRVRGKMGLAQDMLKHVAGSPGTTHLCRGGK